MKTKTVFALALVAIFIAISGIDAFAGKKKIEFRVSEPDAKIYVNGDYVGEGQTELIIEKDECIKVKVEKLGYLTENIEYCNIKGKEPLPKDYRLIMQIDDAFEASAPLDIVNEDFEIKTQKPEEEAWKLLSQIVTNYMDVIEVTDRETGYLRTAWESKHFKRNTIRTRIIIKLASSDPLSYKIKIVSEESGEHMTSVKDDHHFTEYNRVMRKYKDVITEMQSRLAN